MLSSANGEPPYALLQGSGDLSRLSEANAGSVCRQQIEGALGDPYYRSEAPNATLHFILTVDAA
jgi:hypothetical protein